jgi:hypothetical protein
VPHVLVAAFAQHALMKPMAAAGDMQGWLPRVTVVIAMLSPAPPVAAPRPPALLPPRPPALPPPLPPVPELPAFGTEDRWRRHRRNRPRRLLQPQTPALQSTTFFLAIE